MTVQTNGPVPSQNKRTGQTNGPVMAQKKKSPTLSVKGIICWWFLGPQFQAPAGLLHGHHEGSHPDRAQNLEGGFLEQEWEAWEAAVATPHHLQAAGKHFWWVVHREFQTAPYSLFTTITNLVISRQKIEIFSFNYSCCLKELKFCHSEVNYSAI